MPGTPTELTLKLEISRRQFFQWHLIERRPIREVKERMDQLTKALNDAGYGYSFVAEEKAWISRSRHWNISGTRAWKIQRHQKGQGLCIPAEIADVPVWIEWDRDVGDWRKKSPTDNHRSPYSVPPSNEHQESRQNIGHWHGHAQNSTRTQARNSLGSSHGHSTFSQNAFDYAHIANPPESLCPTPHSPNPGATTCLQQTASSSTPIHTHSLPMSEQACDSQQQDINSPYLWHQHYATPTPIPPVGVPLSNAFHGSDHNLAAFATGTESSLNNFQTRSTSALEPTFQDNTCQGQTRYQNGHALHVCSPGSHHPHGAAAFPATQTPQSWGPSMVPWVPCQRNNPRYDSASSQGVNGE